MGKQSCQLLKIHENWVRRIITDNRLTQIEIAEAVGLSTRSVVNNFIKGRPVECGNFQRIAALLGMDWEVLCGIKEFLSNE